MTDQEIADTSIQVSAPRTPGLTIFEAENPHSVINKVTPAVARDFLLAKDSKPELFNLDEKQLLRTLRRDYNPPTPTDHRLRMKFWFEYDRSAEAQEKMTMANVYANVCSLELFQEAFIKNPAKVAWLLCPPASYEIKVQEALGFGLDRMRDILEMDTVDPVTGKFNVQLAKLQKDIVQMLDLRIKGGIVQKVETKSVQMNINAATEELSQDALDRKLKELRAQERRALKLKVMDDNEPIEAEVVETKR